MDFDEIVRNINLYRLVDKHFETPEKKSATQLHNLQDQPLLPMLIRIYWKKHNVLFFRHGRSFLLSFIVL